MPDDNSTTLPRRQLDAYLREFGSAANMYLEGVAPLIQLSVSTLSRIERGLSGIRVADLEALCHIYGVDDPEVVAGLISLAKQGTGKSWWQGFDDVITGDFEDSRLRSWHRQGFLPWDRR